MKKRSFPVLCVFALASLSVFAQEPVDTSGTAEPEGPRFFETHTDIYANVEEMPRFPGCEEGSSREVKEDCALRKMVEYIYTNLQYPEEALEKGISGTAIVSFVVEKDGSLTHLKVERDPGGGCGQEALRVFKSMPPFIPGKQRGEPVRVRLTRMVKFSPQ